MPRPKSHFKKNGDFSPSAPRTIFAKKPDIDNLAKAVLDALTLIRVWLDDDQVAELHIQKRYANGATGCLIQVLELKEY